MLACSFNEKFLRSRISSLRAGAICAAVEYHGKTQTGFQALEEKIRVNTEQVLKSAPYNGVATP